MGRFQSDDAFEHGFQSTIDAVAQRSIPKNHALIADEEGTADEVVKVKGKQVHSLSLALGNNSLLVGLNLWYNAGVYYLASREQTFLEEAAARVDACVRGLQCRIDAAQLNGNQEYTPTAAVLMVSLRAVLADLRTVVSDGRSANIGVKLAVEAAPVVSRVFAEGTRAEQLLAALRQAGSEGLTDPEIERRLSFSKGRDVRRQIPQGIIEAIGRRRDPERHIWYTVWGLRSEQLAS